MTLAARHPVGVLVAAALAAISASSAEAAEAPRWVVTATTNPTHLVAGGTVSPTLVVSATNVGGAATDGSAVTLEDTLPNGLTASAVTGFDAYRSGIAVNGTTSAPEGPMTCSTEQAPRITCTDGNPVDPGDTLVMTVVLGLEAGLPSTLPNQATASGGGATSASSSQPLVIGGSPARFGPTPGSVMVAASTGQAGAHADLTTAFTLNTEAADEVAGYPRDIRFDLPPGFVGTTVGRARCQVGKIVEQTKTFNPNACPSDTMVGMVVLTFTEGANHERTTSVVTPVYNIAPDPGEPAAFAFDALVLPVRLDTRLLSNGDYGVQVTASSLTQEAEALSASVTFWGVPADHNGPGADKTIYNLFGGGSFGGVSPDQSPVPLLSNPQQCSAPLSAVMSTDSWADPGAFIVAPVPMGTPSGCDHLSLESSFSFLPDTLEAGVPARYTFDLRVPQSQAAATLATPAIRNVRLALPASTVISPAVAWGLGACSDQQFGLHSGEPAGCPADARIGSVEVETPTLPLPLQGQVYLGEPECDPCTPQDAESGAMIRLFVQIVGEGQTPIIAKLAGRGKLNQQTGQLTTIFDDNPQLPFGRLRLSLNGGSRAPLANARACGPATSQLDLTPWTSPFGPDLVLSNGFEVGQGCFGYQFSPAFVAGTTNVQAGRYTPFTLSFGRGDRDDFLGGLEVRMPPGLLGSLATVTRCNEPQAAAGTCGHESEIGHVEVVVGPGATPFMVGGGRAFLTDGYRGAPFGLSIVVPAVAGPYTLAGTTGHGSVVVRAAIRVDPNTAALTVASDPLPTALDGIPLQVRAVNVTVDRPGFIFNPTNCSRMGIGATLRSSSSSASAAISVPFQVADCASLPFHPKLSVLTQARTSKANGAYLHVKVSSGAGQANIGKVKVALPKQLPARLTTLQQACPDAVFNANPATCPAGSVVGSATAVTPVLSSLLTGPAYLVSHAGAAFPDLVVVLQGEGITLDLVGNTDIKKGVTSSTFNSVPDAPVSTFDLVLRAGPHSALGANLPATAKGSLCRQTLVMPTLITGQNGALIGQRTKIAVSGCPKHGHARRATKRRPARAKTPKR